MVGEFNARLRRNEERVSEPIRNILPAPKRAALSRPSGEWNDDDFDVLTNGEVVGRIYKANAAPAEVLGVIETALRAHFARAIEA